ncbi:hypothetical protein ACOMHN_017538 [Nucella lapillus]
MARIERKVHYVGTWREDKVTDGTMGQIIARSLAEKGKKVKVKLSRDGLVLSKTVLLQENLLSSQALHDVYFLTVNQRHPCCLLCIVADPVRKYLILALRTSNPVEAQEIISTFKALKDNPTIDSGNVVLKRKDNGNWTLRERTQHNANRHLQDIFIDDDQPTNTSTDVPPIFVSQPNGSAGGSYAPVIDGRQLANQGSGNGFRLVPEETGGEGVVVVSRPKGDVDELSQELQDVKFVVEKTGSVSSATLKSNTSHKSCNNSTYNNNNTEKSYYIETEVQAPKPAEPITLNNGVIQVLGHGDLPREDDYSRAPGGVRAVVEDYREDGVVRAHSNGSAAPQPSATPRIVVSNGGIHHPITVPEPTMRRSTYTPEPHPGNDSANGYSEIPAYQIQRRVSTEYVQMPDFGRKVSQTGSLRSTTNTVNTRVSFDPEVVLQRSVPTDPHKYRSLRTSRYSGVPTTVIRPIEEVYRGHRRHPAILRPVHGGMYVAPSVIAQPPPSAMYVHRSTEVLAHPRRRRSRPNSIHVMNGNELRVFHKAGEVDDILL